VKQILVADDNVNLAQLIARALPGYQVTTAHNGLEALALGASLRSCDLLIADYLMPALTGDQVANRLRTHHPNLKTLLVSGHDAIVNMHTCGPDAVMAKPLHFGVLRKTVRSLIGTAS
jgi:CheY-like chemotaxis protein